MTDPTLAEIRAAQFLLEQAYADPAATVLVRQKLLLRATCCLVKARQLLGDTILLDEEDHTP